MVKTYLKSTAINFAASAMVLAIFTSKDGSITNIPKLTIMCAVIPNLPSDLLGVLVMMPLLMGAVFFRKKLLKG